MTDDQKAALAATGAPNNAHVVLIGCTVNGVVGVLDTVANDTVVEYLTFDAPLDYTLAYTPQYGVDVAHILGNGRAISYRNDDILLTDNVLESTFGPIPSTLSLRVAYEAPFSEYSLSSMMLAPWGDYNVSVVRTNGAHAICTPVAGSPLRLIMGSGGVAGNLWQARVVDVGSRSSAQRLLEISHSVELHSPFRVPLGDVIDNVFIPYALDWTNITYTITEFFNNGAVPCAAYVDTGELALADTPRSSYVAFSGGTDGLTSTESGGIEPDEVVTPFAEAIAELDMARHNVVVCPMDTTSLLEGLYTEALTDLLSDETETLRIVHLVGGTVEEVCQASDLISAIADECQNTDRCAVSYGYVSTVLGNVPVGAVVGAAFLNSRGTRSLCGYPLNASSTSPVLAQSEQSMLEQYGVHVAASGNGRVFLAHDRTLDAAVPTGLYLYGTRQRLIEEVSLGIQALPRTGDIDVDDVTQIVLAVMDTIPAIDYAEHSVKLDRIERSITIDINGVLYGGTQIEVEVRG